MNDHLPGRLLLLSFAAALGAAPAAGQEPRVPATARYETGFLDRMAQVDGSAYRYQVFVPPAYAADRDWPVILFLHGAGERGDDGMFQTEVGLGRALRRHRARFPAIIVFPQTPSEETWFEAADVAMAALDRTLEEFRTDPDRVYLTGLSMGGGGTWYLAYTRPDRFAALVPICAWLGDRNGLSPGDSAQGMIPYDQVAERIRGIPTWIFHGEVDPVVPVEGSRRMAAALEALGSPVRYTEVPGTEHNSWDAAYESPSLVEWLFRQRRGGG